MAGERRSATVGSRCGRATIRASFGVPAGTGHTGPQADRCPRRCGAHQLRQRDDARQAHRMGWPIASEGGALHGGAGSHPAQPCDPGLLPEATRCRQSQESRPGRLHGQATDHTQQHDEIRSALGSRNYYPLISKTVALPPPFTHGNFGIRNPLIDWYEQVRLYCRDRSKGDGPTPDNAEDRRNREAPGKYSIGPSEAEASITGAGQTSSLQQRTQMVWS